MVRKRRSYRCKTRRRVGRRRRQKGGALKYERAIPRRQGLSAVATMGGRGLTGVQALHAMTYGGVGRGIGGVGNRGTFYRESGGVRMPLAQGV